MAPVVPPIPTPIRPNRKHPAFWGLTFLSIIGFVVLLVLISAIRKTPEATASPSGTPETPTPSIGEDTFATKNEVSAIRSDANSLKGEVTALREGVTSASNSLKREVYVLRERVASDSNSLKRELTTITRNMATKNDLVKLEIKIVSTKDEFASAMKKHVIDESNRITPHTHAMTPTATPAPITQINILLISENDNMPRHCYRGVRLSDITRNGKQIRFLVDGKPIDWNQKVIFGHQYKASDSLITGAVSYATENGGTEKVSNISSRDIYQDNDGTMYYVDLRENFFRAPRGATYVPLPNRP